MILIFQNTPVDLAGELAKKLKLEEDFQLLNTPEDYQNLEPIEGVSIVPLKMEEDVMMGGEEEEYLEEDPIM